MRVRLEIAPGDCWIGLYWKTTPGRRYRDPGARRGPRLGFTGGDPRFPDRTEAVTRWDAWACFVPCLPIHFTCFRPRAVAAVAGERRAA